MGVPAKIEGNEHMVSLRVKIADKLKFGEGHFCGGSLISVDKILTAAHCLIRGKTDAKRIIAVMGILDRMNRNGAQKRNVLRTVAHRKYNFRTMKNDIGLVFPSEPFDLTQNVKIIEYATVADYKENQEIRITGWGHTSENEESSEILLTANVKIVNRDSCKERYFFMARITSAMFCAGGGGRDSCQGDSGGPALIDNVQYGIVSFGKGCADPQYPGVYTDVAFHKEWIDKGSAVTVILDTTLLLSVLILNFLN